VEGILALPKPFEPFPPNLSRTLEDVQYHLYVMEKVQRGFEEVDNGKGIPHDQIEREFLE
jgi:hypothetical protein